MVTDIKLYVVTNIWLYIYNWVANYDLMVADNQRNVVHIIDNTKFIQTYVDGNITNIRFH
jgi:hypothetical protein